MLKLARRARGHFVTLIEIRVHLIRVKPGHISVHLHYPCFQRNYFFYRSDSVIDVPNSREFIHFKVLSACELLYELHTKQYRWKRQEPLTSHHLRYRELDYTN